MESLQPEKPTKILGCFLITNAIPHEEISAKGTTNIFVVLNTFAMAKIVENAKPQ